MTNNEISLILVTAFTLAFASRIIRGIIARRKRKKLLEVLTFDYVLQLYSDEGLDWNTLSTVLIYVRKMVRKLT